MSFRTFVFTNKSNRGYTLVEMLVVVAILAILAASFILTFREFAVRQQFLAESSSVAQTIADQKHKSLTGIGGTVHGVYMAEDSMVLFEGEGYSPSSPDNVTVTFAYSNATTSLSAGTTTVYFDGLTGTSSATGTIYMYNDTVGVTSTIQIYESGAIDY